MRLILLTLAAVLLSAATAQAAPNGNFLIGCQYDHAAPDDPIKFPGQPGVSHHHAFFGVIGLTASATTFDLLAHDTTCASRAESAAVWHPTIVSRTGASVTPVSVGIYYRALGDKPAYPFPLGLRHIQGSPTNKSSSTYAATYRCANAGTGSVYIPTTCGGVGFEESIYFPRCWNGESINPPDHHPLVACTGSNIVLPQIQLLFEWPASAVGGQLVTDIEAGAQPGLTAHADYWFGADPIWFAKIVERCLNTGISCRPNPATGAVENAGTPYPRQIVIPAEESDGVLP